MTLADLCTGETKRLGGPPYQHALGFGGLSQAKVVFCKAQDSHAFLISHPSPILSVIECPIRRNSREDGLSLAPGVRVEPTVTGKALYSSHIPAKRE